MGVELTIMDLDTGKYLVLDKVAPHIWGHLDSPICVRDLVRLADVYEVTSERCQSDVPSPLIALPPMLPVSRLMSNVVSYLQSRYCLAPAL